MFGKKRSGEIIKDDICPSLTFFWFTEPINLQMWVMTTMRKSLTTGNNQTKMSSFWRNFHRRLHRKLSKWWQCSDKNTKTSSKWHIRLTLRWRHNEHDGVSNHQPRGCLLNRLFRRRSKKTTKLRVTGLCVGNSPGPVNSPHKGPVTRKMFPFDDVIMSGWVSGRKWDPVTDIVHLRLGRGWLISSNGPLTRYVKLQVAHAPGMPGTFPPPPISKETAR